MDIDETVWSKAHIQGREGTCRLVCPRFNARRRTAELPSGYLTSSSDARPQGPTCRQTIYPYNLCANTTPLHATDIAQPPNPKPCSHLPATFLTLSPVDTPILPPPGGPPLRIPLAVSAAILANELGKISFTLDADALRCAAASWYRVDISEMFVSNTSPPWMISERTRMTSSKWKMRSSSHTFSNDRSRDSTKTWIRSRMPSSDSAPSTTKLKGG